MVEKFYCGGGRCFLNTPTLDSNSASFTPTVLPDNDAYRT
jgi:hypothetical protein